MIEDFGAILLDQDPATVNYWDWCFARLKIGICDESHWIMYKDASGHVSRYDILFEIEHDRVGSYFNPSRPRSEGGTWTQKSGSGTRLPSGPRSTSSGQAKSAPSFSSTTQAPPPQSSHYQVLADASEIPSSQTNTIPEISVSVPLADNVTPLINSSLDPEVSAIMTHAEPLQDAHNRTSPFSVELVHVEP